MYHRALGAVTPDKYECDSNDVTVIVIFQDGKFSSTEKLTNESFSNPYPMWACLTCESAMLNYVLEVRWSDTVVRARVVGLAWSGYMVDVIK